MQNHSESQNSSDLLSQQYTSLKGLIEQRDITSLFKFVEKEEILEQVSDMLLQFVLHDYDHKDNFTYNIIHFLLQRGADPNILMHFSFLHNQTEQKQQMTLLMYSLFTNNINLFHLTLQFTSNVSIRNSKNLNAIMYYILHNKDDQIELLQELISLKADVNSFAKIELSPDIYEWHSVFTLACLFNQKMAIKILLENGVDTNYITTPSNNTGLHIALLEGHFEIAEMLIKVNGIKLNIANCNGDKPYDIAKMMGKEEFALYLSQNETITTHNNTTSSSSYINEIRESFTHKISEETKNNSKKLNKRNNNDNSLELNSYNSNDYSRYSDAKMNEQCYHMNSIQIPFEFNRNIPHPNNLSSFIKTNKTPLICLDLSINGNELELKIKELTSELSEKNKLIRKNEEMSQNIGKRVSQLIELIKAKDTEMTIKKKMEEDSKKEIAELKRKNEFLQYKYEKKNSLEHKESARKKQIMQKFHPNVYDDIFVINYLQKDLVHYHNHIKEIITAKKAVVDQIVANIQLIVNDLNPDYQVILYGSYSTGLSLPWSDLDVVLESKSGKMGQDIYFLKRLYNLLSSKPWITEHKIIENTAIPIIKLVSSEQYLSFKIDISIQEEKHYGLKCVKLVQNYLLKYDVLEPLIIALKTILQNTNLNNPYSGGLSSYGLILMVVSFLQSQHDSNLFLNDENRLGRSFVCFLRHYGISFDSKKFAISVSPIDNIGNSIDQDNRLNFSNSNELIIVDPLNKQNNVAKSTFQFISIKMAFLIAYMVTKEDCECGCHYGGALHENDHYSTEHCILKRIFTSVKRFSYTNNSS